MSSNPVLWEPPGEDATPLETMACGGASTLEEGAEFVAGAPLLAQFRKALPPVVLCLAEITRELTTFYNILTDAEAGRLAPDLRPTDFVGLVEKFRVSVSGAFMAVFTLSRNGLVDAKLCDAASAALIAGRARVDDNGNVVLIAEGNEPTTGVPDAP